MNSVSFNRALMSGGLWFAVAYGLGMAVGTNPSLTNVALDAGIMAGSAVGADVLHGAWGWEPTGVTSHVTTGAMYAAISKLVRGDSNYMVNAGMAAANDFLVEKASQMQSQRAYAAQVAAAAEEDAAY